MKLSTFCLVLAICAAAWASKIKYNTNAGPRDGVVNVHIVPHTHDGTGCVWQGGCCSLRSRLGVSLCRRVRSVAR
jgi:hypothetical protein